MKLRKLCYTISLLGQQLGCLIAMLLQRYCLLLIKLYRFAISPLLGPHCRFTPTCSCYAHLAIVRYGVGRGVLLSLRRLLKCHPWHPVDYDPVP